jgi:pimeloyl-ACP methyl ester carboxylesterase
MPTQEQVGGSATPPTPSGYFDIRIVMKTDFHQFVSQQKDDFLQAFADAVGIDKDEIQVLSLTSGCVVGEFRLPQKCKVIVLETITTFYANGDDIPPNVAKLLTLLQQYGTEKVAKMVDFGKLTIVQRERSRRAIVFVHGWTGDQKTFGNMPTFIQDIVGIETRLFVYPTGIFTHSPAVADLSGGLRNWLRNELDDCSLAFVVHSLGGLVVRQFIVGEQDYETRIDLAVRGICFIASPHSGSKLATAAKKLSPLASKQVLDLEPDSSFLTQLDDRWSKWVADNVSSHERDCRLMSIVGTADKIVTGVRAKGLGEERIPIMLRDHKNIVTPKDRNDEVVKTVARFLREIHFFSAPLIQPSNLTELPKHNERV